MANPLTASLSSTRSHRNRALPGDTITFAFASPPTSASDVEIDIQQAQFLDGGDLIPGRVLAEFKGSIQNGKYVPRSAQSFAPPKLKHVPVKLSDGTNTVPVTLVDTDPVALRNELQIAVRGRIAGAAEFFIGRAALFVEYPLAMLVPTQTAKLDPALNILSDWARRQWQPHDPELRRVSTVSTVTPPTRSIQPSDYDSLISAFRAAVQAAPGGIIALTIGHGDGGQGNADGTGAAWCDLMPEDVREVRNADGSVTLPHRLYVDDAMLGDGSAPGRFPQGRSAVVLNALDRVADELAKAALPIRKLLLHTCNAGNSAVFLQRFADRVRVPVQAHNAFVAYTGFINRGHVIAHYDQDPPTVNGERHWPLSRMPVETLPGAAPKRFPP